MNYQQLTEGQRYQISALFSENYPIAKIAHKLGVHRSTIYRELKRNKSDSEYCPDNAHRKSLARKNKAQKRRLPALTEALVLFGLERDWSPQQISAIGHLIKCPVSHEWIYQYIMRDKAQGGKLFEHLRQGHKKYRRGKNGKRETIKNAVSIDERPNEVDTKERFGDWEADTVMGKRGTGALVTLAERKSRHYLIALVPDKNATTVGDAIISMLRPYKQHVHTITFDRGGEFAEHERIATELETKAYFAHPYSSWERGLNENSNGLLRQYIPKRTNLTEITDEYVSKVERRLNLRPRKCLGFKQPEVVFNELRQAA